MLALYKNDSEKTNSEIFEDISNDYPIFFKQNVYNSPFLTCWILNELLFICSNTATNAICNLEDFYFSLLRESLELRLSMQKSIDSNYLGCILCIISRMNINEVDATQKLKFLFPMLLKENETRDIQLALYARRSEQLFKQWCIFINEINVYFKSINNFNDVSKIQDALFHNTSTTACSINKNKFIQRICNNKRHWVIDILVSNNIQIIKFTLIYLYLLIVLFFRIFLMR